MFAPKPKIILFDPGQLELMSIHSWFVFFPLDVYWLDSEKQIVAYKRLKPFSNNQSFQARYVLETPSNLIPALIGDKIKILLPKDIA